MSVSPLRAGGGILGRFLGNTIAEGAAFAAGVAIGPVLGPPVQELRNRVNGAYPFVYPGAELLAAGVAQGQIAEPLARKWASYHGIGDDAFSGLVAIANSGPGVAEAFHLWRRGVLGKTPAANEAAFRRALRRASLEPEWIEALVAVKLEVLDPADLARGIHRGLVPDPGLLRGTANPGPGKVPAYPQYDVDAIAEALAAGLDREHLGVLVGLQGNPMGAHEAAQALFRGILEQSDYLRAIAEGNTRNEWAEALLEQSRQIPTARDYLENALRGYATLEEAIAGAAKHGMSEADATLIYQNQGRPMNVHAITQALARGGRFEPEPGEITDPYLASIVEGNLKPAYYDLERALRYTMPSTFAIRALAQSKVWNEAKTRERLLWSGWHPDDAADVAHAWATSSSSSAKEATAADLLTLYDGQKLDRAATLAALEALGYPADEATRKLEVVEARKVASAKTAAIGDLHTAYKKGSLTRPATLTALRSLGLSDTAAGEVVDAWQVFLTAQASSAPPSSSASR